MLCFYTFISFFSTSFKKLRASDEGGGWRVIDLLGAEDSFRCSFPLLQEVPEQHKGAWAKAFAEVLRRWKEATCKEEADRALMWLGFLPQALLREAGAADPNI